MNWLDALLCIALLAVLIDANLRRVARKRAWQRSLEPGDEQTARPPEFGVARAAVVVIAYTALLIGAWRWDDRPFADLGFDWHAGAWGTAATCLAAVYIVCIAGVRVMLLRGGDDPDERAEMIRMVRKLRRQQFGIRMSVPYVMLGGVWEELVFRGYVYWLLTLYLPPAGVLIVCAAVFGLGHASQGPRATAITTAIGLLLTALRMMSGNVILPAIVHAAHNANVALVIQAVERMDEEEPRTT